MFDTRGKLFKQFEAKGIVRALCKLPEHHPTGAQIAAVTNEGVIRLWTLEGKLVSELQGHENFVYSLATLPSGEILSCGEDRSLRVWKGSECVQMITHPAISVWDVAVCAKNGDIITGASDNLARIFTRDPERYATPEAIKEFSDAVSTSAIPKQTVPDFKTQPPEFLQQKSGTKEGQTVLIKNPDGSIDAHQWSISEHKWILQGRMVDGPEGAAGSMEYNGKQYDYVIDVDIEDGKPPLKLPYNRSENPYDAATKFLQDNELPMSYLEQTAQFIINSTQGATIGQDPDPTATGADPWGTENRYRPGQASSYSAAKAAATPNVTLRPTEYVPLTSVNHKGVTNKILDLNQRRQSSGDQSALTAEELDSLTKLFQQLETPASSPGDLQATPALQASLPVVVKMATTWSPPADRLAALDILRVLSYRTPELAKHDFDGQTLVDVLITSGAFDPATLTAAPNVSMIVIRAFANLYCTEAGRALIGSKAPFGTVLDHVINATENMASSRLIALASATYFMNTAIFLTVPEHSHDPEAFEVGLRVVEGAINMLQKIDVARDLKGQQLADATEPTRRLLLTIGTLLEYLGDGDIKRYANETYQLDRQLNKLKTRGQTLDPRIPPIVAKIKSLIA